MKKYIIILLQILLVIGCNQKSKKVLNVEDIEIFKNTVGWDLIQSVDKNNIPEIQNILKQNRKLVNFQDPFFGTTALMWAVSSDKYQSAKTLLDYEANSNLISKTGTTALFRAISYSRDDTHVNEDPKFVKLLLAYKADPNINYCSLKIEGQTDPIECGTSPLMYSVSRGFEKVKLLVNAGADINYHTTTGKTAAIEALLMKDINTTYFLVVEKKADISQPYYFYSLTNDTVIEKEQPHYPVDLLLDWVFDLNSLEYQKKKEIIEEFKKQGVEYKSRKESISKLILRRIKKRYPNSWQEYLEKY